MSKISVDFPKILAFGKVHLVKPTYRKIVLRNHYAIELPYEIEILEPHPYFHVEPCRGVILPQSFVTIQVSYKPITLGSSAMALRLTIKHVGVTPKDCVVSARAYSGLLEKDELIQSKQRIQDCLGKTTEYTNNNLNTNGETYRFDTSILRKSYSNNSLTSLDSELRGLFNSSSPQPGETSNDPTNNNSHSPHGLLQPLPLSPIRTSTAGGLGHSLSQSQRASRQNSSTRDRNDPTAALLAVTFHGASNTYEALSNQIAYVPKPARRSRPEDNGLNTFTAAGTAGSHSLEPLVLTATAADVNTQNQPASSSNTRGITANSLMNSRLHTTTSVNQSTPLNNSRFKNTDTVDNILLGSRVYDKTTQQMIRKTQVCARPRGLGAGNVFDAGAEWMSNQFHIKHLRRLQQQQQLVDGAVVTGADTGKAQSTGRCQSAPIPASS